MIAKLMLPRCFLLFLWTPLLLVAPAIFLGAWAQGVPVAEAGEEEWRILHDKEFTALSEEQKREYLAWAEGHAAAMRACVAAAEAQLEVESERLERVRAAVQTARESLREAQAGAEPGRRGAAPVAVERDADLSTDGGTGEATSSPSSEEN
jgi:hypothetical protein